MALVLISLGCGSDGSNETGILMSDAGQLVGQSFTIPNELGTPGH